MNSTQFMSALAVAAAVCAAITDYQERRIPNWLTYTATLLGLALQGMFHGRGGLLTSAIGGLVFGGTLFLFYIIRAMGAGDVKLAVALGCIVGLGASLQVLFLTALAGGLLAIIFTIFSGRFVETLRNTLWVVAFHGQHGLESHPTVNLDNPAATRMPYGLAFAVGTLYWAVSSQLWR